MTVTSDDATSAPGTVASRPPATAGAEAALDVAPGSPIPASPVASIEAPAEPTAAAPRIGYIPHDGSQWFVRDISAAVREAVAAVGYELVECEPGVDRASVSACAERLAKAEVSGLVSMQPFSELAAGLCATVGDVPAVGIVYDQGPCQVALLEVDQTESGRLAGAALGSLAAERWDCDVKAYVALGSGSGDTIGSDRMSGFRAGYKEHCDLPRDRQDLADAQHLITAQTKMADVLEGIAGKPILVAGVTDLAALGALAAAREQGRQNHVWVAGQLVDPAARKALACDQHFVASVAQFPDRLGEVAVGALADALEGREVAPVIDADLAVVRAADVRGLYPDTPACDG